MGQLRICTSAILTLSALLLPAALNAGQRFNRCDQLRAELARQAQALKQQHADETAQCETTNGLHSQVCDDLGERQREEMRQLKESTLLQLQGCTYSSAEFMFEHNPRLFYYQSAYPYRHHHHHHHHPDHDGDGHHGHDSVRGENRSVHSLGENGVRATHPLSGGSSLAAGAHPSNFGHVGGSLGHSGTGHSGFGTAWHGGSVYAAGTSSAGGHVGSSSTGGGAMFSGGHNASYGGGNSGGYSGGYSGGGAVTSGHSGGFSGGSSMSSGSSSSSSSSSSGSSSGGHVR